ncbi:MAG: DEAD/DEAH box helicase family protein [Elusimicrobiota bacterium]
MLTIYSLVQNKVKTYINSESSNNQSAIGDIIKHIKKQNKLRIPQEEAIEVYIWLKFIGKNMKLSDIVRSGLLFDETETKKYEYYNIFKDNYTTLFLNQFAQDNNLKNLSKQLLNNHKGNWDNVLDELLHKFDYPNYLFSLPMGAGKTYLMAAFIYLDLFFANLNKNDKRFAHNFVVFAPSASKTAILPSLQTIKNFNPEWILPKQEADRLKQIIHIEILDSLGSQRRDKLHGNNPNLEKVNRLTHLRDFGLVFITNAEKVVLEEYDKKDLLYTDPLFYDEKKLSELKKINELREKLSQIPYLTVILDEVHHTYGIYEKEEKKLRQAVNILNQHKNVVSVIGLSGTPYVRHTLKIGESEIKLNQIQDIVYNYSLADGIGKFLKVPEVKGVSINEKQFIQKALDEFFSQYDITYPDRTKSKIAFYCPSIKKLNEDFLPSVQEWYNKNRKGKENEIFKFYSGDGKKENKQYQLPKDSLAIFNNLDKPYSDKRAILLVAIGKEGWDCKSLTAVVLPRQKTTKNFVLQTTCRCLREVDNSKSEKALIYLDTENYETLDRELKENYNLTIKDLKPRDVPAMPVTVRKSKLGRLAYKQISKKFTIITKQKETDYSVNLKSFDFDEIKSRFPYSAEETKSHIGRKGLVRETRQEYQVESEFHYAFEDLIYDIAKYTYGKFSENELLNNYPKELGDIYQQIKSYTKWLEFHPSLRIQDIARHISSYLMEEISYQSEVIKEDVEVELLEWDMNPPPAIFFEGGKFIPDIKKDDVDRISKRPNRLEEDFTDACLDPNDMSFNYIPYKMDSDFERNALLDLLKENELKSIEVYYNGYQNNNLRYFWIKTDYGTYTPDFLVIKRKDGKKYKKHDDKGDIEKVLIIETKGKIYYTDEFKNKERFVKEVFLKHNPKFGYICLVDEEGKNDFNKHLKQVKELIQNL